MKYFYIAVILLISLNATAQIEKGQNIISGNFALDYTNFSQSTVKSTTWNPHLGLEIHHFMKPGITVGVELNGAYYTQAMKFTENGASKPGRGHEISIIPQIRKYWKLSPFYVYAGAGLNLSHSSSLSYFKDQNTTYSKYRYKAFSLVPQARLGLIYPVNRRFAIEAAGISNIYPASFDRLQLGLVLLSGENHPPNGKSVVPAVSALTPGRWIISGTFKSSLAKGSSFDQDTSSSYRNTATLIQLGTGVFTSNRWLVGADITLGFDGNAINDRASAGWMGAGSGKPWSIGIRPYVRKYLVDMHLTPYWEVGASYNRIIADADPTNTYSADGNFGLAYIFGKHWIMQAKLASLTVGYSKLPDNAMLEGADKISAIFDATLKPAITLVYSFR
jgi:hypothetical protein